MAVLWNVSKCSHTTCMIRFFTVPRLAMNPNLIFEIGSRSHPSNSSETPIQVDPGTARVVCFAL
jgi:hypothetical protein